MKSLKKYILNKSGHFGKFGGRYIPELLIPIMEELETVFYEAVKDRNFKSELKNLYQNYSGRPTLKREEEKFRKTIKNVNMQLDFKQEKSV